MTTLLPTPGIENLPASVQQMVQAGFLLRFFNDALFTQLVYRMCYEAIIAPVYLGQSFTFTRKGLRAPVQDPMTPPANTDITSGLTSSTTGKEQYSVTLAQYADPEYTNTLSSSVAIEDLYKQSVEDLGLQAGQSLDIQARRRLFLAYNGGRTYVTVAAGPVATITVNNVAGFDFVYVTGVRQVTSVTNPHPVTITESGVATTRDVTAVSAGTRNDATDTYPGTLTLNANVTVIVGDYVLSDFAPPNIRPGGAVTDFDLTSGDILTLQNLIDAAAGLRARGVPAHDDGYYHAIMDATHTAQLWQDTAFQRAFQSLPDSAEYQYGAAGTIGGVKVFETQQAPNGNNSAGLFIRRAIVTGKEVGYEARFDAIGKWLDLIGANPTGAIQFSPEAWVAMILRPPLDILQQVVTAAWSFIGDWVCTTDSLTSFGSSSSYYKRAALIASA